jgi:hypothetical protein
LLLVVVVPPLFEFELLSEFPLSEFPLFEFELFEFELPGVMISGSSLPPPQAEVSVRQAISPSANTFFSFMVIYI